MIQFFCQSCGSNQSIADKFAGKNCKCSACGADVYVPEEGTGANPVAAPKAKKPRKFGCSGCAKVLVILLVIFYFWGRLIIPIIGEGSSPSEPPRTARPISDITYFEIRDTMGNGTSVQQDQYAESLEGTRVQWTGHVMESKEDILGRYRVTVNMDPPALFHDTDDVVLEVTEAQALSLSKGQQISFDGVITDVYEVLGLCRVIVDVTEIGSV